jgi:hypothetical protein
VTSLDGAYKIVAKPLNLVSARLVLEQSLPFLQDASTAGFALLEMPNSDGRFATKIGPAKRDRFG